MIVLSSSSFFIFCFPCCTFQYHMPSLVCLQLHFVYSVTYSVTFG
jgi:hypothetical protein